VGEGKRAGWVVMAAVEVGSGQGGRGSTATGRGDRVDIEGKHAAEAMCRSARQLEVYSCSAGAAVVSTTTI
jgi:hypothetical protein